MEVSDYFPLLFGLFLLLVYSVINYLINRGPSLIQGNLSPLSILSLVSDTSLVCADCAGVRLSDIFVQGSFPLFPFFLIFSHFRFFPGSIHELEISSSGTIDASSEVWENYFLVF